MRADVGKLFLNAFHALVFRQSGDATGSATEKPTMRFFGFHLQLASLCFREQCKSDASQTPHGKKFATKVVMVRFDRENVLD